MLDFDKIARMTDRQLYSILHHRRDKNGQIKIPDASVPALSKPAGMTLEQELSAIDELAAIFGADPKGMDDLKAQLRAKREKTDGGD